MATLHDFPASGNIEHRTNNMDYMTIIIVTLAAMGVVGMAWIGGYEVGSTHASSAERELADRRIKGLLAAENKRKPRARRNRA